MGEVGFRACITGHMTSIGGGGSASRGRVCIERVGSAHPPSETGKEGSTFPTGMLSFSIKVHLE